MLSTDEEKISRTRAISLAETEQKIRRKEVWSIPESGAVVCHLGRYFRPRLPGGQLLSEGCRQNRPRRPAGGI